MSAAPAIPDARRWRPVADAGEPSVDVVIPTTGRPSLARLLDALTGFPGRILVVDDRREVAAPLAAAIRPGVEVLRGAGRGPARARNLGTRASRADWVAFLDDDVVPPASWTQDLEADLAAAGPAVAGVQGRVEVPLPADRRPTDWERNVAGLSDARWATADLAYRRGALQAVGGFDERLRRAYREDADLGLRLVRSGRRIERGRRHVRHPVGPADRWVSLRLQAGNADDRLMDRLHGRGWREAAGAPRGRLRRHVVVAGAGAAAVGLAAARRPKPAAALGAAWAAGVAELAWARIAPGPRTREEISTMLVTSALMPSVAAAHGLGGLVRRRRLLGGGTRRQQPAGTVQAVLLDRDGTLVSDVPYNGDPSRVQPMPGAREALDRLRAAGLPLAVVSNQSGVARGLLEPAQVDAVNRRAEQLLGPIGEWLWCPHGPDEGCACRKPSPGLLIEAAGRLGVEPSRCVMIGDIGADAQAARAAGARAILVPTARTRREEIDAAQEVAGDLGAAVDRILGEAAGAAPSGAAAEASS